MNQVKNYISQAGYKRLCREQEYLLRQERPKICDLVSWAASNGDRSENADYQYGKKRLREIDRRLRFLAKRIRMAEVIDITSQSGKTIRFGATVDLNDELDHSKRVIVGGIDEIDSDKGIISWRSPLGKALIGRSENEDFELLSPNGQFSYQIIKVLYIPWP